MFSGVAMSDQMARLRQFETIRDLFGGPVVLMLLEYPLIILMLVTIALMAWQLALILAGLIVVFLTIGIMIAPAVRRASRMQGVAQNRLNKTLLEILAHRHQIGREGLTDHWVVQTEQRLRDVTCARR
jgi:ATP-binding cassette subfamily C protein/ATP-binding cassette subfamily C protein LapB